MSRDRKLRAKKSSLPPLQRARMDNGIFVREIESSRRGGVGESRASRHYSSELLETLPDPALSFHNFVSCDANVFPFDVARKVASGEASPAYNPFYIFSSVGLGKTHLLSAIANAAQGRVLLVNMADIEVEFELARRLETRAEFRRFLCAPEILLIDDVQLCEGDELLQREIFAVFNHALRTQRWIVFSSDVPPTRLGSIEERLVSRLGGGVILGLQMCGEEERKQILRRCFGPNTLPADVIDYLAENVTDNIRHIKGAAKQLIALSDGTTTPITLDMARAVVPLPQDLRRPSSMPLAAVSTTDRDETVHLRATDRVSLFREMLDTAESEEEQVLALQIAFGERLRELRENKGDKKSISKLERALELIRENEIGEAMKCMDL
ncbi:MAG: ATP-binding protein [Deltaproteobacteria bacterium]|nr:ATP-binding protein [Deltaproteobacteria bacterium]